VTARLALALVLCGCALRPCAAQSAPPDSTVRDSLLNCAVRQAAAAGFKPIPRQAPGRVGMMRSNESPGRSFLLDGLRLAVGAPDATGSRAVEVRVSSWLVSRSTGLSESDAAPRPSLLALADSLRARCRWRSGAGSAVAP
jgi:hypothetical protein